MNKYHYPDELLTGSTFWKVIKYYIPNEFLETVDDTKFCNMKLTPNNQEELVQYVLDNSNHKMRMYGNAKELTGALNLLRTFPMCYKFFECERSEPYNSQIMQYRDANGKSYISKDAFLISIQSIIQRTCLFPSFPHKTLILTPFLKIQEETLKDSLEFILSDGELNTSLKSEMETAVDDVEKEVLAYRNRPKYSLDDYIDLFTKLLPESCTAKEIASLREYVIDFYNKQIDRSWIDPDPLFWSYIETKLLLNLVKQMTEKMPHKFFRWIDLPPEMKFKVPAIARSFNDKPGGFFIEAELEEALKIYQTGQAQPSRIIEGNFLYTIDADAAREKYGTDLIKLTILQDDSLGEYLNGTPIPTNFGVFVVSGLYAFYRLFRRIVFVHKVFQKLKNNNMEPFVKYIEIIDEVLDLRGTRKYMLKIDALHRLEKMTADYWNEVLPQSAKDVRNAKSDGFTVQNLKNELVHLGLTNAFPNIADYAEEAYAEVLKAKRDEHLRTCDLFNAIQTCQTRSVLERCPILAHFYKTQGGIIETISAETLPIEILPLDSKTTDRVSKVQSFCAECVTFKSYPSLGMFLEQVDGEHFSEIHWKATFPETLEVYHNFSLFSIDELHELTAAKKISLFILDEKEFEEAKMKKSKNQISELMRFSSFTNEKRQIIYLRSISISVTTKERIVFAKDVLDVMKFLQMTDSSSDNNFEYYSKKWKTRNKNVYMGINEDNVKAVLRLYNCDPLIIAFVPDPISCVARHRMIRESGFPIMYTLSPDGQVVMHRDQAIYHIFQRITSRIDWTKEYCEQHPNCMEDFKTKMLEVMQKYIVMGNDKFVTRMSVNKSVKYLESLCNFKIRENKEETLLYQQSLKTFDEQSDYTMPEADLEKWYTSSTRRPTKGPDAFLKIWESRGLLERICLSTHIPKTGVTQPLHTAIEKASAFRLPVSWLKNSDSIQKLIANPHLVDYSFLVETSSLKESKAKYKPEDDLKNTPMSSIENSEESKYDDLRSQLSVLKTQMENARTEIDTFREQKLDEKLSKCREQIEVLERERSAHSNCSEKMEKLNAKIKKGEEREKKLEETNKALENSKEQMKKKMDKLEAEKSRAINAKDRLNERLTDLEASNKQHKEKEKQRTKLIQKLEGDVKKEKEKNEQIQKLQDKISEMEIQKQEMERMIQELTAPGTSSSEVSKENQSKIEEYQRWKKYICEQLRKARKMADKLATNSSNDLTRRMAIYEISQFEVHVRTYVETIDTNIQKMETFNGFAEISIPTNYPSFSQKFLEEYWKLPKEETENGLEDDMECLICHDDMTKGEGNLLKCHECSRFYHIQCAVRWIQEKHRCAVCKDTMVDPNELPYFD